MTVTARKAGLAGGLRTFAADVAEGFFEITHNGLALVGIVVVLAVALLSVRADLREQGEARLASWLTERQAAALGLTPELVAADRATAADPDELPREQANVAQWISKKYKVAVEPLAALVAEAYAVGTAQKIDPTLILAVMAIESSFNPFAQSHVGAQGLMQVMTEIHSDKYQHFGGEYAAFDPKTNLRVGVRVLQECITRAGSIGGGLRHYVGAANLPSDGGYAEKVLAEHARLYQVAKGRPLPAPIAVPPPPVLRTAASPSRPTAAAAVAAPAPPAATPVAAPVTPAASPAEAVNVAALAM